MNDSQFLYHYTSIETLALILKNRTIRFNSLCNIDDLQEQKTKDTQNFGNFVFVSCWTDCEIESIPMWSMYANKNNSSGGVRIKSYHFPFARNAMTKELAKKYYGSDAFIEKGPIMTALSAELFFKYFYFPQCHDVTLYNIEYTDKPEVLYPTIFPFTADTDRENFIIYLEKMGRAKRAVWDFQQERRYVLYASPFPMLIENRTVDNAIKHLRNESVILENIKNGTATIPLPFVDISLEDYFFDKLEITLSPTRRESDRIIVESLVEKYTPNAVIKESDFYVEI